MEHVVTDLHFFRHRQRSHFIMISSAIQTKPFQDMYQQHHLPTILPHAYL